MDREASSGSRLSYRVDILGVAVSAVNLDMAVDAFGAWIRDGASEYVCVTGVHGVMECQSDPELLRIHNESGMTTPDGMPLVWCGRYAGVSWMERVYGPDLLLRVCAESVQHGWSHFFYGAGPDVADELAAALTGRFPGLKVAGMHTPPFRELTEEETLATVEMINIVRPDIVWVGLSTPKQERWMARLRPLLAAPVLVGVGAAFDIHAGRLSQAPRWMQRSGLEWAYRLAMEPRRLWRRYLYSIPRFIVQVLRRKPLVLRDRSVIGDPD
jgi:N-acetylglucosaminyldiphosphoundecaprenol N-acetyl-beta-D-mannosaminyltransferase